MELLGKNICDHIVGDPPTAYTLFDCPRCLSKGVYGDIVYDGSGRITTLLNSNQLRQQLEKILIENIRETGYGVDYKVLGGVIDSGKLLAIKRELTRVVNYFINNQQQEKASGFYYKTSEEVDSLDSVDVYADSLEPRKIIVLIGVTTVSGKNVSIKLPLRR